jgi:phage terminase large subunit-like protein
MNLLELQQSPAAFRDALLIDGGDGQPVRLADAMEPWQRADFEVLDPGWRRAAGQDAPGEFPQRAWLERPRGHSKSADAMVMATWALFAARKQLAGIVAAVDRDQAALDRDHVARLVALNPWLEKVIAVNQWSVVNRHTGSTMDVISSDVASSYGLLLDFAVLDELSVWPKRDLFDSIFSAAAKRSSCLLLAIGNAGFKDSWQWSLREAIRRDPAWFFARLDGPVATWITERNLAEQRRLLPTAAYDRLWLNVWSAAGGDALDEAAIANAFFPELRPLAGAVPGYEFVAGVDAGVSRDASAVCVLGVKRTHQGHGRIRLAHTRLWRPTKDKKVNLQDVEDALLDLHERFGFREVAYDPWQMTHLASRLQSAGLGKLAGQPKFGQQRREGVPMVEVAPTGQNLQRMATAVIEAFNDRRLELYDDADLKRDLSRMRVVEKSYGFRIESPRDGLGHGDLGTAFMLALLAASELASKRIVKAGVVTDPDADPNVPAIERAMRKVLRKQERIRKREAQIRDFPYSETMEKMLDAIDRQYGQTDRLPPRRRPY